MLRNSPQEKLVLVSGMGTNGGTIAFNVRENNWLGEGVQSWF